MKEILIPTDFTEKSRRALDFGVSLFAQSGIGANFILIATFPFRANGGHSWVDIHDEWKRSSSLDFAAEIEQASRNYSLKNISFETLSFIGSLENVLSYVVRDRKIDCVILGTHPEARKEEEIARILSRVRCPVLLVPFAS